MVDILFGMAFEGDEPNRRLRKTPDSLLTEGDTGPTQSRQAALSQRPSERGHHAVHA